MKICAASTCVTSGHVDWKKYASGSSLQKVDDLTNNNSSNIEVDTDVDVQFLMLRLLLNFLIYDKVSGYHENGIRIAMSVWFMKIMPQNIFSNCEILCTSLSVLIFLPAFSGL